MKTITTNIKPTTRSQHQQLLMMWDKTIDAIARYFTETQLNQLETLYIQHRYFEHLNLFHIEIGSSIAGFIGLMHDKIEILMVSPEYMRQGVATQLIHHAIEMGSTYVDVNENNTLAYHFYLQQGFEPFARSEFDSEGYPNPILHLHIK